MNWYIEAAKHNVIFNGMQSFPGGKTLPMFTSKQYGTFVVNENETLDQAIERKQKQFTVAPDSRPAGLEEKK